MIWPSLEKYALCLIEQAKVVPSARFEQTEIGHIAKGQAVELPFGKNDRVVYVIEEVDGDPDITFGLFKNYKADNSTQVIRACPKDNKPSEVLYVGSCTTGIKSRIEQHLGRGHYRTSALQLEHWFEGQFRIGFRKYDVSADILQLIEDGISLQLRPAFGKLGGNGRRRQITHSTQP